MDFMLRKFNRSIVSELHLTFDVMLEEKQVGGRGVEIEKIEEMESKKRREAMQGLLGRERRKSREKVTTARKLAKRSRRMKG
jgi:hypothetical protein